jgi:hypothetical protein
VTQQAANSTNDPLFVFKMHGTDFRVHSRVVPRRKWLLHLRRFSSSAGAIPAGTRESNLSSCVRSRLAPLSSCRCAVFARLRALMILFLARNNLPELPGTWGGSAPSGVAGGERDARSMLPCIAARWSPSQASPNEISKSKTLVELCETGDQKPLPRRRWRREHVSASSRPTCESQEKMVE